MSKDKLTWKDIRVSVLANKVADDQNRDVLFLIADSIRAGLSTMESFAKEDRLSPTLTALSKYKDFIEHEGELYFALEREAYKIKTLWKPFVKGQAYKIPSTKGGKQLLNVTIYNHFIETGQLHPRIDEFDGLGGIIKTEGVLFEYFTPPPIVEAITELLTCFTLPNTKLLEPSAGIGNLLPVAQSLQMDVTAVELNPVLGNMLSLRYPKTRVILGDFLQLSFEDEFGCIIGNPPYGKHPEGGKKEQRFLDKCYSLLAKGGIMVMVLPSFSNLTTSGEIIQGFQLPSGVFPNTSISTDLLLIRKL